MDRKKILDDHTVFLLESEKTSFEIWKNKRATFIDGLTEEQLEVHNKLEDLWMNYLEDKKKLKDALDRAYGYA